MEQFFSFASKHALFPASGLILCAVSGGADSMYLLANLAQERKTLGFDLAVAHYDHNLRASSFKDAQFVKDWCRAQGIPCILGSGDVATTAQLNGTGTEETARIMRYTFLQETATQLNAAVIATAHTADDNGETLLMNLVRGCGLDGMSGIPPRRGNIVRPLLQTTRQEIEHWLTVHQIPHIEDESNTDERYTRNFVRRQIMPLLKQINPRAVEHMTAAAERMRYDNDLLNGQADVLLAQARQTGVGWTIPTSALQQAKTQIALRAIRVLLRRSGGEQITSSHLEQVLQLANSNRPSAELRLVGVTIFRQYEMLVLQPFTSSTTLTSEQPLYSEQTLFWGDWQITRTDGICPVEHNKTPNHFWLSAGKLKPCLTVRSRQAGDRLKLLGRPEKTVKKWLIDEKIPRIERDGIPILWDGIRVAAVGGLGPEEKLLAKAGESAFHIVIRHNKTNQKGAGDHES